MSARSTDTAAYIEECIGPRRPGTLWRDNAGNTVRVLSVDLQPASGWLWEIVEVDEAGQQVGYKRTHSTPWDADRNTVISQPGGDR